MLRTERTKPCPECDGDGCDHCDNTGEVLWDEQDYIDEEEYMREEARMEAYYEERERERD
jgi:hypothetical protein